MNERMDEQLCANNIRVHHTHMIGTGMRVHRVSSAAGGAHGAGTAADTDIAVFKRPS